MVVWCAHGTTENSTVHQNDCHIRTSTTSTESQASDVEVRTDLQNSSCFQEDKLSNDVKKIKNNCTRCILTVARNGENAIAKQRRTEEQLQQHALALSKVQEEHNTTRTTVRQIEEYNRRQQRVVWPAYHPAEAKIGLLWKIKDYRQKKERNECETSHSFLSSRYGYTMCVQIYFNGNGSGKGFHLSIFFALVRSEIDDILTWPFSRKVKLMILDQTGGGCHHVDECIPNSRSKNFEKPQEHMNIPVGFERFMTHLKLETPQYVKENTLCLMVDAEYM
ncbi:TNF receptor-associated factor 5-like isoform X2 [Mizuhopecten yessoensis]|uniref:TNF receptor-associated factor 5-like isoform X2 n=1 Tax=Mizuhopecten yessoensis TaxID=6573 RepID=UPI000B45ADC1|nr:TNF receptor-associated factor 5-like isoform X2 [Mizuhopecten yessoensis]